jgi:hypothetical protein
MDTYFTSIVDRLTLDDIEVLNTLTSKEALNRFSAKTKQEILQHSGLTEAKFRKCIYRLDAINFIEIFTGNREHLIYVTEYGLKAIQYIIERSNV